MAEKLTETTHVIFDYGGTVGQTTEVIYQVLQGIVYEKCGETLPESFKMVIADGDTSANLIEKILVITKLEKIQKAEILEEYRDKISNRFKTGGVPMVSGVHKLIRHLCENQIQMAIATNMKTIGNNLVISKTIGLDLALFSHITNGGDDPEVMNNKPAPNIYHVCAKRFKSPPKTIDSCVIFEDSILGITGAVRTGMKTVFLNEYKRPKEDFETIVDKITVIVNSFDNFKPESIGLPPFKQ